jgi:hypothetical protein
VIAVTRVAARAGTLSPYTNRLFYAAVLGVSLTGAGQAATGWLHWWAPFAFLAVAAVELGGVALSMHADRRRQLGERAIPARVLSAAVAVGAVLVNYFGHQNSTGQAAFFAGMSALGYTVWLIDSAARRRDALRSTGDLPPVAPVYGLVSWVRHPGITRRARVLAMVNAEARTAQARRLATEDTPSEPLIPALTALASLAAARAAVRADRRSGAISAALRTRITEHVDPTMATIAVNTYDLDEIAQRLADGADYDGLTGILAAELVPARLHSGTDPAAPVERVPARIEPAGRAELIAPPVVREILTPAPVVPLSARLLPVAPLHPVPADDAPISGAGPVDLTSVSKTAAVHYAHTALGKVPASRVIAFLSDHGVTVSESAVYKARRQVAAATTALPAYPPPAATSDRPGTINGHRPALAAVPA